MPNHICTSDERGLCESCETLKRDEMKIRRMRAWQVVEDSRVEMVRGLREEMVYA